MGLSRHIRLAIIGAVTLLFMIGHASSSSNFQFPDCVDKCIIKGDCVPTNSGCLCKAARGIFLKTVLKCMHASCKADLATFEDSFLKPMTEGCDDINQAIPKSSTKAAKALANSLLAKLSTATATSRTPMSSPVGSSPRITTATISTTSTSTSSSSDPIKNTSTVDRDVGVTKSSSPSPDNDSGLTQLTSLTSSGTETQATSSASPGSDFVDTSPFSNTNSAGLRNRLLTALLGLPLGVALLWQ